MRGLNFSRLAQQVMKHISHVTRAKKMAKICVTCGRRWSRKMVSELERQARQHYRLSIKLWVGKLASKNVEFKLAFDKVFKEENCLSFGEKREQHLTGEVGDTRLWTFCCCSTTNFCRLTTFGAMKLFHTTLEALCRRHVSTAQLATGEAEWFQFLCNNVIILGGEKTNLIW